MSQGDRVGLENAVVAIYVGACTVEYLTAVSPSAPKDTSVDTWARRRDTPLTPRKRWAKSCCSAVVWIAQSTVV